MRYQNCERELTLLRRRITDIDVLLDWIERNIDPQAFTQRNSNYGVSMRAAVNALYDEIYVPSNLDHFTKDRVNTNLTPRLIKIGETTVNRGEVGNIYFKFNTVGSKIVNAELEIFSTFKPAPFTPYHR